MPAFLRRRISAETLPFSTRNRLTSSTKTLFSVETGFPPIWVLKKIDVESALHCIQIGINPGNRICGKIENQSLETEFLGVMVPEAFEIGSHRRGAIVKNAIVQKNRFFILRHFSDPLGKKILPMNQRQQQPSQTKNTTYSALHKNPLHPFNDNALWIKCTKFFAPKINVILFLVCYSIRTIRYRRRNMSRNPLHKREKKHFNRELWHVSNV